MLAGIDIVGFHRFSVFLMGESWSARQSGRGHCTKIGHIHHSTSTYLKLISSAGERSQGFEAQDGEHEVAMDRPSRNQSALQSVVKSAGYEDDETNEEKGNRIGRVERMM